MAQDPAPTKRALIISISDYEKAETGYGPLKGPAYDAEIISAALGRHGFETRNMIRITDEDRPDRRVILGAFSRLIAESDLNDIVYIHYSGHGDQVTDDDPHNPDDLEPDGYDEVIVPMDAPTQGALASGRIGRFKGRTYDGSLHIRDDEIRVLLDSLGERLGPGGHIFVVFDSCNSGSATRGDIVFRSGDGPIGMPAMGSSDLESSGSSPLDSIDRDGPTVVQLFAARYDQKAVEMAVPGGATLGVLSKAVAETLDGLPPHWTYRAFFEKVKQRVQSGRNVLQVPQMEGDEDTLVLNGTVVGQEPYFQVTAASSDTTLHLEGGSLQALYPGTRLALFPVGTASRLDAGEPLATGTVSRSDPMQSVLTVDRPLADSDQAWAFVTHRAFPPMNLNVLVRWEGGAADAFRTLIEDSPGLTLVQTDADILVEGPCSNCLGTWTGRNSVFLVQPAAGETRTEPFGSPLSSTDPEAVFDGLKRFARFAFLRSDLTYASRELAFDAQIKPTGRKSSRSDCREVPAPDGTGAINENGDWVLSRCEVFSMELQNTGERKAWFSILALRDDGCIKPLLPWFGENPSDFRLDVGARFETPLFSIDPDQPDEILKVIITDSASPPDFRPLLDQESCQRPSSRSAGQAGDHPLVWLLEDAATRTRSDREATVAIDQASTTEVRMRVRQ